MNQFDKLAGKKAPVKKSKTVKIAAKVTDDVKKAVDLVIWAKAEIKSLESQQAENEVIIIDHVAPQQDAHAQAGKYSKSYLVEGNKGNLTYTKSDKFSIPQDEDSQAALKKLLGPKYDEFFETVRTIKLLSKVQEDSKLVDKIIKAIETAGIDLSEAFEVTDVVVKKDGLDERQYGLTPAKLEQFRLLVKQAKAALK